MRLAFLALLLCALAAAPARASTCAWVVQANISPSDHRNDADSGSSWSAFWAWQYVVTADHLLIAGDMSAYVYHCTTNLGVAASGNGTFIVRRFCACQAPVEDIEGQARNEFTARAALDNDSFARAHGSQHIKASKMTLDCHACGGVEATSSGYGDGNSGSFYLPLYPGGPSMIIYWSKGGVTEQAFQANDGGTGGRTPETITCQTSLDLSLSVGWWEDSAEAQIKNSKAELKVYGTCAGYCGIITPVIDLSLGY